MKSLPVESSRAPVAVGARLRAARLRRRQTIDQVAALAGVTKGFLSRVERDLTSPSVASLVTLCEVLAIDVGSLFTPSSSTVVRFADAPRVDLGGVGIDDRLVTARSERRVQMLRAVVQPRGHGEEELYGVDCAVEVVHVVTGAVRIVLDDETHHLQAGDTLTFPGAAPHTWASESDQESVVIFVLVPQA